MGKNDVEIAIRARDAVGPGIDAARQKFAALQRIMARLERADGGSLMDGALKFGMVVNGIRGAVQGATAVIEMLKGNADAAGEALERLPLGIGAVVAAWRDLEKAITSTAAAEQKFDMRISLRKSEERARQDLNAVGNTGMLAAMDRERDLREKLEEDAGKKVAEVLKAHNGQKTAAYWEDVERIGSILRIQVQASEKRIELEWRANEEKNQRLIEADVKAAREKAEKSAAEEEKVRQDSIRKRIARASSRDESNPLVQAAIEGAMAADQAAIDAARKSIRGGSSAGGLPGGDQSRFLTGVAASGAQRIEAENIKQTTIAEKQLKKLEDMADILKNNAAAAPAAQINLTVGGFGDIG